jgi:Tol biopolymer transport system component
MKKFILLATMFFLALQFTMQAQSIDATPLVGGDEEIAMNPVFSPDGKMIAFTTTGFNGLFVYNLETNEVRQLSEEISAGYGFKWSSDSKSILSRVARYDGPRRFNSLKIFNVESGETEQISEELTNMPYLPEWIPGNDRVILPQKDGIKIFQTGKEPFFLENESSIVVYSLHNKIVVKNTETSSEKVIEPLPGKQYLNVSLSPDKSKIVFEEYGGNMFVVNIDGTNLTDLGIGYNPQWLYDNQHIIYMITEDDGHKYTASDIFMISINDLSRRNLTNTTEVIELNPSVSPNGKTLAYESFTDGAIYLMNLD